MEDEIKLLVQKEGGSRMMMIVIIICRDARKEKFLGLVCETASQNDPWLESKSWGPFDETTFSLINIRFPVKGIGFHVRPEVGRKMTKEDDEGMHAKACQTHFFESSSSTVDLKGRWREQIHLTFPWSSFSAKIILSCIRLPVETLQNGKETGKEKKATWYRSLITFILLTLSLTHYYGLLIPNLPT